MLIAVIIPFPMGFLALIDKFNNDIKTELHKKSKWGVSPFITQPKAINPSNRFKFLDIINGISKVPGTLTILIFFFLHLIFL